MKPTDEQAAIYERAERLQQGDVLNVIAFAGAGKTTIAAGPHFAKEDMCTLLVVPLLQLEDEMVCLLFVA